MMLNTTAVKTAPEAADKKNSQTAAILRRFWKNKLAVAGLFIIIFIMLVAIFAPVLAPYPMEEQHLKNPMEAPSSTFWFGTDQFGRDIFSRVIYGARTSLLVGFGATAMGAVFGTLIGAIAGYFGGFIDDLLMRIIDIILAIPAMLMAISISAMLGPGLFNAVVAISISSVGQFARITRASILQVREQEYIEAVRALGSNDLRIIAKHIFPNILAPLIVQISLRVASSILAGSSLSFIGLGVQPPIAEWGAMLSSGRSYIRFNWWLTTFPGLAIMLTVYGFNLIGDGLRDALDPRLKN